MRTFKDVINLWPRKDLLAAEMGVKESSVAKWAYRNSIPSNRWADLITVAKKWRFKEVNAELLVKIAKNA